MAETYGWMSQLEPLQNEIEKKLVNKLPVEELEENVKPKPDVFKITRDGIIILRGGREGQVLVLMPLFSNNEIKWICIGGSKNATPAKCK